MLHQQLPQFLCEDIVGGWRDSSEGDEDCVRCGEAAGRGK